MNNDIDTTQYSEYVGIYTCQQNIKFVNKTLALYHTLIT